VKRQTTGNKISLTAGKPNQFLVYVVLIDRIFESSIFTRTR